MIKVSISKDLQKVYFGSLYYNLVFETFPHFIGFAFKFYFLHFIVIEDLFLLCDFYIHSYLPLEPDNNKIIINPATSIIALPKKITDEDIIEVSKSLPDAKNDAAFLMRNFYKYMDNGVNKKGQHVIDTMESLIIRKSLKNKPEFESLCKSFSLLSEISGSLVKEHKTLVL